MNLPNKTNGYQRKAQTILGQAAVYAGATSVPAADQPRSVVLTSLAMGPGRRQQPDRLDRQ